ncbi:unnamed protein product [Peronospora belbahrii]|uniref:Uncharacterized protein n=1 Tax=Peronospora belbahrii TaxID=622444 RepID=A0AAU9L089_9STRA|nr:unnamed protein product [Peronospora belbahrii]
MLENAKKQKDQQVKEIASKLEIAQALNWAKTEKSPEDVIGWLGFNDNWENLLTSPALNIWYIYVTKRGKHENPFDLLVTQLTMAHKDEEIGEILALLTHWSNDPKTSTEVYSLFQIDKADNALDSPLLLLWASYCDSMGHDPVAFLFENLQAHYKHDEKHDAKLARAIIDAKQKHPHDEFFVKMEQKLLTTWQAEEKDEGLVFDLLGLDKVETNIFALPAMETWVLYVQKLKGEKWKVAVLKFLQRSNYDIHQGNTIANAKTSDIAAMVVVQAWLQEGKDDADVFELLDVISEPNGIDPRSLRVWAYFVKKLNAATYRDNIPDEARLITRLLNYANESALARALAKMKHKEPEQHMSLFLTRLQNEHFQLLKSRYHDREKVKQYLVDNHINDESVQMIMVDYDLFLKGS